MLEPNLQHCLLWPYIHTGNYQRIVARIVNFICKEPYVGGGERPALYPFKNLIDKLNVRVYSTINTQLLRNGVGNAFVYIFLLFGKLLGWGEGKGILQHVARLMAADALLRLVFGSLCSGIRRCVISLPRVDEGQDCLQGCTVFSLFFFCLFVNFFGFGEFHHVVFVHGWMNDHICQFKLLRVARAGDNSYHLGNGVQGICIETFGVVYKRVVQRYGNDNIVSHVFGLLNGQIVPNKSIHI